MLTWPVKDPDEVVGYSVDWSPLLGADEIATNSLVVLTGTIVLGVPALDASKRIVSVSVLGGLAGETATLRNRITTVGGFTYEETISLLVVSSEFPVGPSTTRKRVIVEMAVQELKLASYEFDFQPEEYVAAVRFLDGIAQDFPTAGYNQPAAFGYGEIDDPSGLADADVPAFALILAEPIASMIGKMTLSVALMRRIAVAKNKLAAKYSVLPTMQLTAGTPIGAGYRWRGGYRRYTTQPI